MKEKIILSVAIAAVVLVASSFMVTQTVADENPSAPACVEETVLDDFEDGDVAGWATAHSTQNGRIEAVAMPVSPSGGDYVGKVTFDGSCYGPHHYFDPVSPDYISWYLRTDGYLAGQGAFLHDGYHPYGFMVSITYYQGALRYDFPARVYHQIMPASDETWYLIELKNIDWDSDTFDIWVDGVEKIVGAPFRYGDLDYVSYFQAYSCSSASPIYLDDIKYGTYGTDCDYDGVPNDVDMCLGSLPDDISLNPNQYAQNASFGPFEVGPNNDQSSVYDMSTTYGCTCTQIVEELGAGKGHLKKGCSPSLMEEWTGVSANPDRKAGIGKKK